jgi:hypothetical protein
MEVKVRPSVAEEPGELGKQIPVACDICEFETEIWISRRKSTPKNGVYAKCPCPGCSGRLLHNYQGISILVKSSGPGVSSTKYGMRRAREITRRNEELSRAQWDNVEPIQAAEGLTPRNPTPGGPLDPNGPFKPKKRAKKLFTPPTS